MNSSKMNSTLSFVASPPDGFKAKPYVPFLDANVEFTIWPQVSPTNPELEADCPTPRQLDLARRVLKWPNDLRESIDDAAEQYRSDVDDSIDLALYELGHINRQNIRDHYRVYGIAIPSFEKIDEACDYVWLLCSCDWEDEHGMECIFRDREIIFCGESDCLFQAPHFREWTHVNW